ncbi:MAG: (2Fe-2S)-binding protein [Gammaproteobacteria bacterium]|jgi:isoquinoline 1-oxidoreductase alpha subunit|nr:(2Fe-2S)-binding protein [Gammaproteobacteria bacterium]
MVKIVVNGEARTVSASPDTPLLWVLRDHLQLTGTKYGCGISLCGACTVHLEGEAVRSCTLPLSAVADRRVETIEHLAADGEYNAVQSAWLEEDVAQCGYCQSGQIMAATALLNNNPSPSDAEIDAAMAGQICRCGTYQKIRAAIHRAAKETTSGGSQA